MHVHGARTRLGVVDWDWDGSKMEAAIQGRSCAVRLGPGFPKSAALNANFQ